MRDQYKVLAKRYQLIVESTFWKHKRLPNEVFDSSREDFLKLVSIEKPTDITQFSVIDAWVDDHQICVGVSINNIELGLWWLDEPTRDGEHVIPASLSEDSEIPLEERLQDIFNYLQNWFNYYEPDEINDPLLKGVPYDEIRDLIKKRHDILNKGNPGIEIDI
jgi:hypothetical protein